MKQKKKVYRNNTYQVISGVFLCAMLTAFLFCFQSNGYQSVGAARYYALIAFGSLYFAAIAVMAVKSKATGARLPLPDHIPGKISLPEAAMLLYALFTLISCLVSQYRSVAFFGAKRHEGALSTLLYVGIFCCLSFFSKPKKWMLYLFGCSVSAFCMLCFVQLLGYNPFTLYPAGATYYDAGVVYHGYYLGSTGNIDFTAAFLCVAVVLLLLGAILLKEKQRFLLLLPAAAGLFVLYKIDVLAAYAAFVATAVIAPPVYFKKQRVKILLVLAALAAVGIACLLLLKMPEGSLPYEVQQLLLGNVNEKSGSGRIHIWQETLRRVPEHLWFGTGPDTMQFAEITFTRLDLEAGEELVGLVDAAHNEYLHILFCQGIFALAAYLTGLVSLFVSWVKNAAEDKGIFLLGAAALAYGVQAFFSISQPIVTPFFWIILGLLNRQIKGAKQREA